MILNYDFAIWENLSAFYNYMYSYTYVAIFVKSRLTIVSCEAKKKHSNATTEHGEFFTCSTGLKFANTLARPVSIMPA